MAIEKQTSVDRIEVVKNGTVQVRRAVQIIEDGAVISQSYHRSIVQPGDDYSKEDLNVQKICQATHTPEVIDAFQQEQNNG